jgi:hypothetical protein
MENKTDLERRDKGVVGVQVGYDLESPVEGYNLSLDVFLQDPGYPPGLNNVDSTVIKRRKQTR